MSRKRRQSQKRSKSDQLEIVVKFLGTGKTQSEAAAAAGVNVRTVQRWVTEPEVRAKLSEFQQQTDVIVRSDPVVLTVTDVRAQVQEILNYRNSQRNFALEMGLVVQKATGILLKAVEKLEENPDEISIRSVPQLMRAVADASEKISNAWSRATGLDDLLEQVGNEPKIVSQGQEEV